jgi:hypothetical protein
MSSENKCRYPQSNANSPDEVIEFFPIYLFLPAALWPWGLFSLYEYQILLDIKFGGRVRLTSPPPVSRLSKQCGILDISKPHRLPRPVTGIATRKQLQRGLTGFS